MDVAKLLDIIGTPQMDQEIERRVLNTAKEAPTCFFKNRQTGIEPSLTERDMKQYLGTVLKEIRLKISTKYLERKRDFYLSYEFLICSRVSGLRVYSNDF